MSDLSADEFRRAAAARKWAYNCAQLYNDRQVLLDKRRNKGSTRAEERLLRHLLREITWYESKLRA